VCQGMAVISNAAKTIPQSRLEPFALGLCLPLPLFGTIVGWINALVIQGSLDAEPVSLVDPTSISRRRALRESACHFDPTLLLLGDSSYFIRDLGEILILAEDEDDVALCRPGRLDNV